MSSSQQTKNHALQILQKPTTISIRNIFPYKYLQNISSNCTHSNIDITSCSLFIIHTSVIQYINPKLSLINIIYIIFYHSISIRMEGTQSSGQSSAFNFKNIQNPLADDNIFQQPQIIQRRSQRANTCTGFEIADWKKALQQRKLQSNMFYKGEQVSTMVQLSFFKIYGSGIYLFFKFLWEVSIFFLILTLISLAPMLVNYIKGNAFENSQNSLQYMVTRASIGNYQYTSTGSISQSQSLIYKQINASIDLVMCFMFLIFYFYWEKKSQKIVAEINSQIRLLSSSTIQVTQFPPKAKQADIQAFMNRFGTVSQVAAVKFYSEQISLSKEIYDLQMQIKQLEMAKQGKNITQIQNKIYNLKTQAKKIQKQLESHQISRQQIIKFYVQFQTIQQRDEILKKFKPFQKTFKCCLDAPPPQMLLNDQPIYITQCFTQPTGIIWQNVHVTWKSRWLRMLIQFIIILAIITCGFILISLLNILVPPTRYNVDTSQYTWQMIKKQTNTTIIGSWCVKNIQYPASPYEPVCDSYWKYYIMSITITIGISLVIVIFKTIIKFIMIKIAKFQRYTGHTQQSVAIMTNLLITYISTTVLITFLMQANIFKISFKSFIHNFLNSPTLIQNLSKLTQYYDLTSTWYRDIGYQIWFNVFLLSFIPHLFMPVYFYISQCVGEISASGQKLHRKMYEKIRPAQFQIEDNYANILMIILIGFVFGGGSPCMILVSFIGLMSRYVYYKYIFIRFSRIPKTFNQSLNNRALSILKIILMLRCLLSIYMYGADGIFAMEKSTFHKWSQSLSLPFFSSIFVVVSRILVTWYYSIFVAVFMLALVFKNFIVDTFIRICSRQDINKMEQSQGPFMNTNPPTNTNTNDDPNNSNSNSNKVQMMSQRILTKSYKLQNNPDYYQILAIMKMRYRNSITVTHARQSISPTPLIKRQTSTKENEKSIK